MLTIEQIEKYNLRTRDQIQSDYDAGKIDRFDYLCEINQHEPAGSPLRIEYIKWITSKRPAHEPGHPRYGE
jgi:hypothetical protein